MPTHGTQQSVFIRGTGSYAPTKLVTNEDLSKVIDTTDEWIRTRTGILERRIAEPHEATSDIATRAAARAIVNAGLKPEDIDLVIVATITPDKACPSTACLVQGKLELRKVPCFDIEAACSGFIYALSIGSAMLKANGYKHALVIGAEKLSSIVDWNDRTTCVLFGDGAGAAVLSKTDTPGTGLLDFILKADGTDPLMLQIPAGGSACPASTQSVAMGQHFLKMDGKEVFKFAVRAAEEITSEILQKNGIKPEELAYIIPHQANFRIIDSLADRLELPLDRFLMNLDRFGNTSSASIPLVLDEAVSKGKLKKGDKLLLVAFGAGLTWAASVLTWEGPER